MQGLGLGVLIAAALVAVSRSQAGNDDRGIVAGDEQFSVNVTGSSWDDNGGDLIGGFMDSANNVSQAGIDALKQREGFSAVKYRDAKGYSIGYGHFIVSGENFDSGINLNTAEQLLIQDVQKAVSAVQTYVTAQLTQNQFDALVSFVYNVGVGAFSKSTILKKINNGDLTAVNEFSRWNISNGQVNTNLVTRRVSEVNQFLA